jgi:hypothetical protein
VGEALPTGIPWVNGGSRAARTRKRWPVVEQYVPKPVIRATTHEQSVLGWLPTVRANRYCLNTDFERLEQRRFIITDGALLLIGRPRCLSAPLYHPSVS